MRRAALILTVALLLVAFVSSGVSASYQYNGFIYEKDSEGCITLSGLSYETASGDINVPEEIDGNLIRYIGPDAFSYKQFITSVILPSGVMELADKAFYMCVGLKSVVIPDGVISVGESCFALCEALEQVTVPYSVTSLGDGAFADCKALKTAYIYGRDAIGEDFFLGCDSLESLYLSKGVTSVAESAISDCGALGNIYCQGTAEDIELPERLIEEMGITVHYGYDYEGFPKEQTDALPTDKGDITGVIIGFLVILVLAGSVAVLIKKKKTKK